MALMFPRLARNFAKNGYYPTDEPTLERALNALMPSDGPMCILDPCAGEGVLPQMGQTSTATSGVQILAG